MLLGWGVFNLIEGVIDHEILRLHQVNETVLAAQRIDWDIGFLLWGCGNGRHGRHHGACRRAGGSGCEW